MNCKKSYVNYPFSGAFLLENPLYFDIETTGLSWKNSMVFLIGFLKMDLEKDKWILEQWFLEDPSEERELLKKFSDVLKEAPSLIHYNGQKFDLPYLKGRCQLQNIPAAWDNCRQLDLYQTLRPYQKLMGLDHMRQTDLEQYLGVCRPEEISGKECAAVYKKYVIERNPCQMEQILLHNNLDLTGLLDCTQALAYPALFQGRFQLGECRREKDTLTCSLIPHMPLPQAFSLDCHPRPWTVSGGPQGAEITFCLENGTLRMYYPNYKDYYYLPAEDIAVHKSVGTYVDRRFRRQADALNCFTRFPCTDEFLGEMEQIHSYSDNCFYLYSRAYVFDK